MFNHIDAAQAFEMISNTNVVTVDNRDEQSYENGHIKGAFHLTNETLADFFSTVSKQSSVIVCCYHGNSSQQVAEYLNQQGYDEVYSLDGGFEHWRLHYPYESTR
jgi:thiosulfate sulfurtransferase